MGGSRMACCIVISVGSIAQDAKHGRGKRGERVPTPRVSECFFDAAIEREGDAKACAFAWRTFAGDVSAQHLA